MTIHSSVECVLIVIYINSCTHRKSYFIDLKIQGFNFVYTIAVDLIRKRIVKISIHWICGKDAPPEFYSEVSIKILV